MVSRRAQFRSGRAMLLQMDVTRRRLLQMDITHSASRGGSPGNARWVGTTTFADARIYIIINIHAPPPTHWLPQSSAASALFRGARHIHYQRRFRAKRDQLTRFQGLSPESQGQDQVLTVLHVPCSLDSGLLTSPKMIPHCRLASPRVYCLEYIRQSRPNPGLGFQANVRKTIQSVSSLLSSGEDEMHARGKGGARA